MERSCFLNHQATTVASSSTGMFSKIITAIQLMSKSLFATLRRQEPRTFSKNLTPSSNKLRVASTISQQRNYFSTKPLTKRTSAPSWSQQPTKQPGCFQSQKAQQPTGQARLRVTPCDLRWVPRCPT